jgi:uncharacterized protein YukE
LRVFASTALWSGVVRFILFWSLVGFGLAAVSHVTPYSNWPLVHNVLNEVRVGHIRRVAEQDFAFALSSAIVQLALALAFALFVAHVLLLRAALYTAKRDLGRNTDLREFATRFDTISGRLARNAIIRHAWRQFEQTAIRQDDAVHNTVRPQSFINLADARECLFGLKMMGSIPGFFVGLGLLLTFIGLVLALNKAAGSTGARSAEAMTNSLSELLGAATFKFSTSIAGLGSSLLLSLLFRSYQIWIEGAFDGFGRALEERMVFHPPQRVAADSLKVLAAQRDELKEINSEGFFARLGESVAPRLQHAMKDAVSPISDTLDRAVKELARTSQTGVDDLVRTFIESLNQGAGRELTEVAGTLAGLKAALEQTQQSFTNSGQDFSGMLAVAAEAMSTAVAGATKAAEAFDRAANDVRSASEPLLAHSERVAESTELMAKSISGSVQTLSETQKVAGEIASQLAAHLTQIGSVWDEYEKRFKGVDEDFGRAADRFHTEVERHQQAMRDFVKGIDEHTGSILAKINTAVSSLDENVEELSRTLTSFLQTTAAREAAE